jgi:hypothetical protein
MCAIAAGSKALYCWDSRGFYTGDGTGPPTSTPTPLTAAGMVDGVVTPQGATCFRSGTAVACFGDPASGALGIFPLPSGMQGITFVPGITDAIALSSGNAGVCALRPAASGGTKASCWSAAVVGPSDLTSLTNVRQVTQAPGGWAVARLGDGSLVGMQPGGPGWTNPFGVDVGGPVEAIVGGPSALLCFVRGGGTVVGCADVSNGCSAPPITTVSGFPAGDPVVEITAWEAHDYFGCGTQCARTASGGVYCWGYDSNGQVGVGLADAELTAHSVAGAAGVTRLGMNAYGTAAVLGTGGVSVWGGSRALGFDLPHQKIASAPQALQGASGVARIAIDPGDAFAYLIGASLGVVDYGTITTGARLQASPVAPPFLDVQLFPHLDMGLAGTSGTAGTALAFYTDDVTSSDVTTSGLLGNGGGTPMTYSSVALTKLVGISGGTEHALAWDVDGTLYCWGDNSSGKCGQDPATPTLTVPTAMSLPGEKVVSACGGDGGTSAGDITCAATAAGNLYCWGNDIGGTGSMLDQQPELKMSGASIVGVACAYATVCAWSATAVYCWGSNGFGQVGNGDRTDQMVPTPVVGLPGAQYVSMSDTAACAVTTVGGVACWGSGFAGVLGNGKTGYYASAQLVTGLP